MSCFHADRRDVLSVLLKDGRTLAYSHFGLTDGTAQRTVLLHHGFLSSRLEGALLEESAASLGLRVIAFDRPGCGASTDDPARTPESVAVDVSQLLHTLGIMHPVIMLGISGEAEPTVCCSAFEPVCKHRLPGATPSTAFSLQFYSCIDCASLCCLLICRGRTVRRSLRSVNAVAHFRAAPGRASCADWRQGRGADC